MSTMNNTVGVEGSNHIFGFSLPHEPMRPQFTLLETCFNLQSQGNLKNLNETGRDSPKWDSDDSFSPTPNRSVGIRVRYFPASHTIDHRNCGNHNHSQSLALCLTSSHSGSSRLVHYRWQPLLGRNSLSSSSLSLNSQTKIA
jgi:hypothetical protein